MAFLDKQNLYLFIFSLLFYVHVCTRNSYTLPNILFILTDDQDLTLGGMVPLVKTRKLIGEAGITFNNTFVTTPMCCPSRASILTGTYVHNHKIVNNSLNGNCSSPAWQAKAEKQSFVTYLKTQNYTTFYAGKYLNQYGRKGAGGVQYVPPGWDWWSGLVGNSVYYNYTLSNNGKAEVHGDKPDADYLTDVITTKALHFLEKHKPHRGPFFMMLSPPACHSPFTPSAKYELNFTEVKAPRNGSFNVPGGKDKHWLVRQAPNPMSETNIKLVDETFRDRWRTLLSVDDMVEVLVKFLTERKLIDNTYIFFSSDNGYHLGQFSLPMDKRQLYEFDIRVPLLVRGPGIKPNQVSKEMVLSIDLAPTFLTLAGLPPPKCMDGRSFEELMYPTFNKVGTWRTDFLVEHKGEGHVGPVKDCPQLKDGGVANCIPDCVCEDSFNNTYICVRTLTSKTDLIFCRFDDSEQFMELYNMTKDPDQLLNIAQSIDKDTLMQQSKRLVQLSVCSGESCRQDSDKFYHVQDTKCS